jgi:chlorinating enzyme
MRTNDLKQRFDQEGMVYPLDFLNQDEVLKYSELLNAVLAKINYKLNAVTRHKPHLYLKWVNEIGRDERLLSLIRPLLGNNILLWHSVFFIKLPQSAGFVPWHQDGTYWAMNNSAGLTVWVALSDVNEQNGCMFYVPASQEQERVKHVIETNPDNLLARGQKLDVSNLDLRQTKPVALSAGQLSIHSTRVLHTSGPNLSHNLRAGIAFRYVPVGTYPVTLSFMKRQASLVSGEDPIKAFQLEPTPRVDYDRRCLRAHKKSLLISIIHTFFGDTERTFKQKMKDLFAILFTKKTLRSIGLG